MGAHRTTGWTFPPGILYIARVTPSPSAGAAPAPAPASQRLAEPEPPRWYAHGWNRPLSWRLIYGIVPWLPRPLVAMLRHVMSTVCFACMSRERAAVRRNLEQVSGVVGWDATRLAYRVFHSFSGFM